MRPRLGVVHYSGQHLGLFPMIFVFVLCQEFRRQVAILVCTTSDSLSARLASLYRLHTLLNFLQVVWPKLLKRGWRKETASCKSPYSLWIPPDIVRGTMTFRVRIDFFDTPVQVRNFEGIHDSRR